MVVTAVNAEAVSGSKLVDELLVFDPKKAMNPFYFFSFTHRAAKAKPYFSIDFDQWLKVSPVISFFSGAPRRIGFDTKAQGRAILYTDRISRQETKHELEHFFDILRPFGFKINQDDKKLFFEISDENKQAAFEEMKRMGLKKPFAVIHPGCGSHGFQRQWPEERYAEVIKYIEAKGTNAALSIGPGEEKIADIIEKKLGRTVKRIKAKNLQVLAGVIKESSFFISGNTGIMHLAAAVGARVIALHGPTDAVKWGPYGDNVVIIKSPVKCSPCLDLGFEYGCKTRECMEKITVEEVVKATRV